ncbi:MAG: repeat-containing protein [Frankiales bacterium]|nr:repeat-containing protein [Frankiales bacterium]
MRRSLTLLAAVTYAAASAGLATGLAVSSATPASAAPALAKITPVNGWETAPFSDNGGDKSTIGERFASAAVGDIDGNGVPDLVAGFPDGTIVAWRTDNGARWFTHNTGAGAVQASPGLVDYDRDGKLDIVYANTHGDIGIIRADKRQLFYAKVADAGIFATPAVADLDGNGSLDITVSGFDQYLHAWTGGGGPEMRGFPVPLEDTSWSSPAVGDIDGDGLPEIVVGWDCDGAPGQRYCPGSYGGVISAFNGDGTKAPGIWPRFMPGQVIWSSPALADLDGNGTLDIVVGTGNMTATMWNGGAFPMRGTQVFGLQGNGYDLPGWPVTVGRNVTSSPAIGDITGDGRPEVVFVAEDGLAYAYTGNGYRLWARCAGNDPNLPPNDGSVTYGTECPMLHASAAIADVTGDATQEVVLGGEQVGHVFDGRTGVPVADAVTVGGTYPVTAAPTIANINGRATIYAVSGNATNGRVFGWQTGRALGAADWPTFKGSSARSGTAARPPAPIVVIGAIKAKYDTMIGLLGAPVTNEYTVPGGRAQVFAGGQILWSPSTGAHEVHGLILDRYLRTGGAGGPLGLPVSDEKSLAGGAAGDFQNGTILWTPSTGAWAVQGLIRYHYLQLGGAAGDLGFPTSDEYDVPGGRASTFRGGTVYWSPATGVWSVRGDIRGHYLALGGPAGPLGFPISDERGVTGGRANDFRNGTTYWSQQTGAWSVSGLINEHYVATGGPGGPLSLPVSDEYAAAGGGRASNFLGGIAFWSPASGAHNVQGAILTRYAAAGMSGGFLGFPVTDELPEVGGRSSVFQRGRLYWSPATGAHEVRGAILATFLMTGSVGASGFPITDEYPVPGGMAQDFGLVRLRWDAATGTVGRF